MPCRRYPASASASHSTSEETIVSRVTISYLRYVLATLSGVGFGANLN